jgi:phospholipid-translocating ATPase
VYEQMVRAVEEFFPESNIVDEKEKGKGNEKAGERRYSLQRTETGLSSIVGSGNGDRPGGFVLVADGIALEHVCFPFVPLVLLLTCICVGRH